MGNGNSALMPIFVSVFVTVFVVVMPGLLLVGFFFEARFSCRGVFEVLLRAHGRFFDAFAGVF